MNVCFRKDALSFSAAPSRFDHGLEELAVLLGHTRFAAPGRRPNVGWSWARMWDAVADVHPDWVVNIGSSYAAQALSKRPIQPVPRNSLLPLAVSQISVERKWLPELRIGIADVLWTTASLPSWSSRIAVQEDGTTVSLTCNAHLFFRDAEVGRRR